MFTARLSAGAKLPNAFSAQVETMRRLRNGGTQVIRVERIEVSDTAQAIIGNISSGPSKIAKTLGIGRASVYRAAGRWYVARAL
jgi:hypothetical protein